MASGFLVAGAGGLVMGSPEIPFIAGSVLGSILPDMDHPKSKLGRLTLPISIPLYMSFGHRGGTHSLLFVTLCLLTALILPDFGIGLGLGVLIHIGGDMISYSAGPAFSKGGGCPVFYPAQRKFGFRLVRVNGLIENLAVLPILAVSAISIFMLI